MKKIYWSHWAIIWSSLFLIFGLFIYSFQMTIYFSGTFFGCSPNWAFIICANKRDIKINMNTYPMNCCWFSENVSLFTKYGEWHSQKSQYARRYLFCSAFSFTLFLPLYSWLTCTLFCSQLFTEFTLKLLFIHKIFRSRIVKISNFKQPLWYFKSTHSNIFLSCSRTYFLSCVFSSILFGFCETFTKVQWILMTLIQANEVTRSCWLSFYLVYFFFFLFGYET